MFKRYLTTGRAPPERRRPAPDPPGPVCARAPEKARGGNSALRGPVRGFRRGAGIKGQKTPKPSMYYTYYDNVLVQYVREDATKS